MSFQSRISIKVGVILKRLEGLKFLKGVLEESLAGIMSLLPGSLPKYQKTIQRSLCTPFFTLNI